MSAIISDKFRIYNAEQFLRALGDDVYDSEGNFVPGTGDELNNMYFFVGRPQSWYATLEIYSKVDALGGWASVTEGDIVQADTNSFQATVEAVYDDVILLKGITGANNLGTTPDVGSTLTVQPGSAGDGSTAITGVYRYATEDSPTAAFDNDAEYFSVYDDLIAAKRMTIGFTRGVIRRFNWALTGNDVYDMYKNDYSQSAPTAGIAGKLGSGAVTDRGQPYIPGGASSLAEAKFYVMNGDYEVFKCLYNGQSPANPDGIPAQKEPTTNPGVGAGIYRDPAGCFTAGGLFLEDLGNTESAADNTPYSLTSATGYVWKFMYKLSIDDVLRFLSTDFLPISLASEPTTGRGQVESLSFEGSIQSVLVENENTALPAAQYYAPVVGDGSGAIVGFQSNGTTITNLEIINPGGGVGNEYTYGKILIEDGVTYDGQPVGLFSDDTLTTPAVGVPAPGTDLAAFEVIISPKGGHGSGVVRPGSLVSTDIERELNCKRVMANIRLTYAEGEGDFPVDNDFRRIGILRDPVSVGNSPAIEETLSNLKKIAVGDGVTPITYAVDDTITQLRSTGGTAKGRVVSYEATTPTNGIISYYQSVTEHQDKGVVREFEEAATGGPIIGVGSVPAGAPVDAASALGATGLAGSEFVENTGDILYLENRRLITRAPDQIEDIKLVIEF